MTKSLTFTVGVLMMLVLLAVITLVERSITRHFEMQDEAQLLSLANTIAYNSHQMQQKMTVRVLNQSLNMHQPVFAYTTSLKIPIIDTNEFSKIMLNLTPFIIETSHSETIELEKHIQYFLQNLATTPHFTQHLVDLKLTDALHHSHTNSFYDAFLPNALPILNWETHHSAYRVLVILIPNDNLTNSVTTHTIKNKAPTFKVIIVGMDINFHDHYLNDLRLQLFVISVITALVLMMCAYYLIKRGHRPINSISYTLDHIATGKLKTRITETVYPTELQSLVRSLNQMMDKLDDLFEKQASFSADIAHELRTPMTNLLTQTQIILQRPRSIQAYEEVLYANLEEFERLSKMINDMLFLAKADNDTVVPNMEKINLIDIIHQVIDYFDALSEAYQVHFNFVTIPCQIEDPTFETFANIEMIKRALSNLFSNAILYAKPNTEIKINLNCQKEYWQLSISNQINAPIDLDKLDRLFDRFYRLDPAREYGEKQHGFGIGLAITKAIIHAHGGMIEATANDYLFQIQIKLKSAHFCQISCN